MHSWPKGPSSLQTKPPQAMRFSYNSLEIAANCIRYCQVGLGDRETIDGGVLSLNEGDPRRKLQHFFMFTNT